MESYGEKEGGYMFMRCAVLSVVACVTLAGCAATKHARSVEPSGFLQDLYPQMREGKGDEALLVYRNPHVDWATKATYKKVLLDPVMIWRGKDSKMEGKGIIRIPERACQDLDVKKGELVKVKPLLEEE